STGAFKLRMICCSGSEQCVVSACRVANHSDALRFDAESLRIGAHPAYRSLGVMDQRRKSRLAAEAVLRGDRDISKRGVRLDPFRQRVFAAAGESAAMEMNRGHSLFLASRRPVNIQLQIHIAALAEDHILLRSHTA